MFFGKERESGELLSEPNLITFAHSSINSGKIALIQDFIKRVPDNYGAFYINLRAMPTAKYEDLITKVLEWCVKTNVMFVDLLNGVVKPRAY